MAERRIDADRHLAAFPPEVVARRAEGVLALIASREFQGDEAGAGVWILVGVHEILDRQHDRRRGNVRGKARPEGVAQGIARHQCTTAPRSAARMKIFNAG